MTGSDGEGRRSTVLTVDDSPTLRSLLRDVLTRDGYDVVPAGSGEEALELMDREPIDLVLADLIMPTMDGYELCRRVKDLDPLSPVPVILLTSKGDLTAKVAGFDAGADDYIIKPFKPEELIVRVRAQLRLKALQEELQEKNHTLASTTEQLESRVAELEDAYREISIYRDRTSRAIELASRVQRALLPRNAPAHPGFDVAFMYEPADSIAGDFFDFLPLEGGRTGIAIGDVAGKGVGASLIMVLAMSALRQAAEEDPAPRKVLERVNEIIRRQYDAGEMITLFYGVLDPEASTLTYASAGHEPGILAFGGGGVRNLGAGGPFLGIFPRITMSQETVPLETGDRLLLLTDGVLDRFTAHSGSEGGDKLARLLSEERNRLSDVWLGLLPEGTPVGGEPDDTTAILMEVQERPRTGDLLGEILLEASPSSFREVRACSKGIAGRLHLRERAEFEFVYAVDEAVGHFIQNAPRSPDPVYLEVTYRSVEGGIEVGVSSRAITLPPVDLERIEVQDARELEGMQNWSLFLVRQMSRSCALEVLPGGGSRLRFEVLVRSEVEEAAAGSGP